MTYCTFSSRCKWGRKLCSRADNWTQVFQALGNPLSHQQPSEESVSLLRAWHLTRNWTRKKKQAISIQRKFTFSVCGLPGLYGLNFTGFTKKTATLFAKCTSTACWFLPDSAIPLPRLDSIRLPNTRPGTNSRTAEDFFQMLLEMQKPFAISSSN